MELLRDIAPYVALAAAALAIIFAALLVALWVRVRRLRQAQAVVLGHHGQRDLVSHAADLEDQVRNMRMAVETLTTELERQNTRLDGALSHLAVVRYDAFHDSGGEQSASVALLDNNRSGIVLSTIAARDFARVYVKFLHAGMADRDLSPEELQAITAAVPQPVAAPAPQTPELTTPAAPTPAASPEATDDSLPS